MNFDRGVEMQKGVKSAEELQLRAEIKELLKEANSLSVSVPFFIFY